MKLLILTLLICFNGFGQEILYPDSDKLYHAAAGAAIGAISYGMIYHYTGNKRKALFGSAATALVAGIVKESIDVMVNKEGVFEVGDVVYTFTGGVVVVLSLDIFTHKRGRATWQEAEVVDKTLDRRERQVLRMNERVREKELRDNSKIKNRGKS